MKFTHKYNISVSGRKDGHFDTEEEAWDYIMKGPLGQLHIVYDEKGNVRPEFIPY